jgi:hypothetical protein
MVLVVGTITQARAIAQEPAQEPAEVPGDDIFGFTTPTDVGKAGDSGISSENNGRGGKRTERFFSLTSKTELSRTLDDDTWGAVSLFNSYYRFVSPLDVDRSFVAFDGLSFELERRVLRRSADNPFAVSLSVEPRWARIDPGSGQRAEAYGIEGKMFVDAAIVRDKLFWAMNLNYLPAVQRAASPDAKWIAASGTNVSTALTYAWSSRFYTGVEARYLATFDNAFLGHLTGSALFFGPTALWKITDTVALNVVWTPQIAGRSQITRNGTLDLDNFERHQFRVKLTAQF